MKEDITTAAMSLELDKLRARVAELRADVVLLKGYLRVAAEDFSEIKDKLSITEQYAENLRIGKWRDGR